MHQSRYCAAKGQVSIEFLILLSLVLALGALIMAAGFESSARIFSIANAKDSVNTYLYQEGIENSTCSDTYIKTMSSADQKIIFDIEGSCIPDKVVIIQKIRERYPSFSFDVDVI